MGFEVDKSLDYLPEIQFSVGRTKVNFSVS